MKDTYLYSYMMSEAEIEALNFNLKQMHKEGSVKTGLDEILKNNGIKDA